MITRRRFLRTTAVLGVGCILPTIAQAASARSTPLRIRFYHTHTGEALNRVFWANGKYVPDALADINRLLRDHRNNDVFPIDPQLLSLLERLTSLVGVDETLHVISGYRSPATNRMLADQSDGVARHSLHLEGKAIDIRIPGRDLTNVRDAAVSLRGGGVGFYARSQFVHIDIGRVRSW